jgi:hypothetical protein
VRLCPHEATQPPSSCQHPCWSPSGLLGRLLGAHTLRSRSPFRGSPAPVSRLPLLTQWRGTLGNSGDTHNRVGQGAPCHQTHLFLLATKLSQRSSLPRLTVSSILLALVGRTGLRRSATRAPDGCRTGWAVHHARPSLAHPPFPGTHDNTSRCHALALTPPAGRSVTIARGTCRRQVARSVALIVCHSVRSCPDSRFIETPRRRRLLQRGASLRPSHFLASRSLGEGWSHPSHCRLSTCSLFS